MWVKATSALGVLIVCAAISPPETRSEWSTELVSSSIDEDGDLVVTNARTGENIVVRTISLRRGAHAWTRAHTAHDHDEVSRSWGVATETLRNTARGVAQAWSFDAEPEGDGPLTVMVNVAASTRGVPRSQGIRYGSLSYGSATWIDARGRRTALEEEVMGDAIAIRVPVEVLDASEYPAVLDPIIGAETGVDAPTYLPQEGDQRWPAVASDGSQYLAAWYDTGESRVTVARLGADGTTVTPLGSLLNADFHHEPDVAWDGTNFVVAWASNATLFVTRIAPDGTVLDDPAVVVWNADGDGAAAYGVRIAAGAGSYLVTAQEISQVGSPFARALLLDQNLQIVSGPSVLQDAGVWSGHTDVAFDGQQFVAVWERYDGFVMNSAEIAGVILDPTTMAETPLSGVVASSTVTEMFQPPGIAPLPGGGVLVAWTDNRNGDLDIYARPVGTDGSLGPEQLAAQSTDDDRAPVLATSGAGALVIYREAGQTNCGVCAQAVDVTGASVGARSDVTVAGDQLTAAGSQAGALVGYHEGDDVSVIAVDATGAPTSSPTLLSLQANHQLRPEVARGADDNLAIWEDLRTSPSTVRMNRLDGTGNPLGSSTELGPGFPMAMASDGARWLVALPGSFGVDLLVIPAAGDPTIVPVDTLEGPTAMIHDGSTFMVFEELALGLCRGVCFFYNDIFPSRLADDGTLIETLGAIDPVRNDSIQPAAVGVGDAAFVVFASTEGDVSGALIPHGQDAQAPFFIANAVGTQSEPDIAFDGSQVLVVWRDERTGGSEIRGVRMQPDGEPIDGEPLLISSAIESSEPHVVWTDDGHSFLVTWLGKAAGAPNEVYGAWVTQEGEVLDFPGIPLTSSESPVETHRLTAQGQGQVLLTYERHVSAQRASRVLTKHISSGELDGGGCESDEDCASRSCVDGACCVEACGVCETCNGDPAGICTPVIDAADDTCFGTVTCNGDGACTKVPGQPCDDGAECASGFCVEGLCCDTACDGVCDSCVVSPGTCVTKDCGTYSCNEDKSCRTDCDNSSQCAEGFQCTAERTCAFEQTGALVEQGCGCRVVGTEPRAPSWWWLSLLGLFRLRRREAMR